MNTSQKYLITGGSGYLGRQLIKRLSEQGFKKISVISRNEGNLVKLREEFPFIEIVPGDISNVAACEKACEGVEGIFHLAAFKHVGLAEEHVSRCILSNVGGTMNLLELTLRNKPEFILGISTDKAAQVKGVYGATKLLQEKLFAEFEKFNPQTKYRTVRYGNVLDSTGSVTTKWREAMKEGREVMITDYNATRFYWTVEQAVELIFECLNQATDSTPYITRMKSMKMGDLLGAMMKKYGNVPVKVVGLQPGENKHEIVAPGFPDSYEAERYTQEEILSLI